MDFDVVGEMAKLFGASYESPAITTLLARLPPHRAQKPSGYDQYIISKPGGFDLLFSDRDEKVGGRWHRKLTCIFVYNEGADGHRRFTGTLPFGFSFDDTRSQLTAKQPPTTTWKLGEGKVPIDHPDPTGDIWNWGDFKISAHYGDHGSVLRFQISPD